MPSALCSHFSSFRIKVSFDSNTNVFFYVSLFFFCAIFEFLRLFQTNLGKFSSFLELCSHTYLFLMEKKVVAAVQCSALGI